MSRLTSVPFRTSAFYNHGGAKGKVEMGKFIDLTGAKFGRLTVLKRSPHNTSYNKPQWICECECKNIVTVCAADLKKGQTLSCGCLNKEKTALRNVNRRKRNRYRMTENYAVMYTSKGEPFKIDKEDFDKVKTYCWCKNSKGYLVCRREGKYILLHRLITNCPDDMVVDHINHDKSDNRKQNLRICSLSQNAQNSISLLLSGIVFDESKRKWIAKHKGEVIGEYKSYYEAINEKRRHLKNTYGEYAFDMDYDKALMML